jgi:hypothetical protein
MANGHRAFITYYPFDQQFECPAQYQKYKTQQAAIEDDAENLLIVPETLTGLLGKYKKINTAVWWLSVDNFEYQGPFSFFWLRRKAINLLDMLKGKRITFISSLKNSNHFCQSYYAKDYLEKNHFLPLMLSDYLSAEHFVQSNSFAKLNQIAYNPKKGYLTTLKLINANPNLKFVPIINLSPAGVSQLLQSSKVYIDFGYHPGKDRVPREAALAGCCVITGRQGAASNISDVSIPQQFRLDENDPSFMENFCQAVEMAYFEYEATAQNYKKYIELIKNEKKLFEQQVKQIFG